MWYIIKPQPTAGGFVDRLKTGWTLTKDSFGVVRAHPRIAKTALYVYAVEGAAPDQFENFDFETLGGRTERSASPGAAGASSTVASVH